MNTHFFFQNNYLKGLSVPYMLWSTFVGNEINYFGLFLDPPPFYSSYQFTFFFFSIILVTMALGHSLKSGVVIDTLLVSYHLLCFTWIFFGCEF